MKKLLFLLSLILIGTSSYASHLMGGEITYKYVGDGISNDYEVTLIVYRDCSGIAVGTSQNVTFQSASCGLNFNLTFPLITTIDVSPVCATQLTTCNGGNFPGTEQWIYRDTVTLVPCTDWIIHWNSGTRNPAITNLVNPAGVNLFIMATLDNVVGAFNNSPQYLALPTPYICANQLTIFNHSASDVDGDSLYYALAQPLNTPGPPGTPIAYTAGYSILNPIITSAGMNLTPETGEMCFTPTQSQICVVSVIISEHRNGVLIGTQIREMQVVVDANCNGNTPPTAGGIAAACGGTGGLVVDFQGPTVTRTDSSSFTMCPDDSLCFSIAFLDIDPADLLTITTNLALAIPSATVLVFGNGTDSVNLSFCWKPTPLDSGINVFGIQVEDDACPIKGVQFFTYDITVFDQPFAGPDQIICGTQTAQLQALGGGGYVWTILSGDTNLANLSCTNCDNPVADPDSTTTYLLTSSLAAACVNTDTVTVFVVPDFTFATVPDTALCDFLSYQLGVNILSGPTGTYIYNWNNEATLDDDSIQNPTASPTQTTWYVVEVTSPDGCVKQIDSVLITVTPPPNVTLIPGNGSLVCSGEAVNFDVIFPGCQMTATVTGQDDDPNTDATVNNFTCVPSGETITAITIDAAFVGNFCGVNVWYTYDIIINGTTQLTQQCNQTNLDLSAFLPITSITISANDEDNFSDNVTLNLTVNISHTNSSSTFSWSPGVNLSDSLISNPVLISSTVGITTYTVTITDTATGCAIDRQQSIEVVPDFALTSTQSDTNICLGETVNFQTTANPTGTYTYSWSPTAVMNNSSIFNPTGTFNSPGSTMVIVEVDNGGGCAKMDTMFVNVSVGAQPTITLQDTITTCPGDTFPLGLSVAGAPIGNDPYAYAWTPGLALSDSTIMNPNAYPVTSPTTYYITVTDTLGGCFTTDSITIIHTIIIPPVLGNTSFCEGTSVGVDAGSGFAGYQWIPSGGVGQMGIFTQPGSYAVIIGTVACSDTSNFITIDEIPLPHPVILGDTFLCNNEDKILTVNNSYDSYLWQPSGDITNSTIVNSTGLITLTVDSSGCLATVTQEITNTVVFTQILGLDTICVDGSLVLTASGGPFDNYTWTPTGSITATTVATPGNVSVTVEKDNCFFTVNEFIFTHPSPIANFTISPDLTGEAGTEIVFTDASTGAVTWTWDFDATNVGTNASAGLGVGPFVYVYENQGVYTITLAVTSDEGCTDFISQEYTIFSNIISPNVITPNGDGMNDLLVFKNLDPSIFPNRLEVFNRWGVNVFDKDDYDNDWDGDDLKEGTYFYVLKVDFVSGQEIFKGSLTILK